MSYYVHYRLDEDFVVPDDKIYQILKQHSTFKEFDDARAARNYYYALRRNQQMDTLYLLPDVDDIYYYRGIRSLRGIHALCWRLQYIADLYRQPDFWVGEIDKKHINPYVLTPRY